MLDVSVVICTRNRHESLRRVLGSIAAMDIAQGLGWELVVIDNGSTDQTSEAVEAFAPALPIRRVFEPAPGLSVARNRGVGEARGRYVVWTDDDVVVDARWLTGYLDAFMAHPSAALFAGQVRPVLESPTTDWFVSGAALLSDLMALREFASVAPLSYDVVPFGANYAVRTAEQKQHLYDPNLGVAPGRRRGGEEVAVSRAILASGAEGVTVPASIVNHMIPSRRQTLDYVREFYAAQGEDYPFLAPERRGRLIGGVPPWVLRQLLSSWAAYRFTRLMGGDWLPEFLTYARWIGTCRTWRAFPHKSAAP
jgi:hypothetical protein